MIWSIHKSTLKVLVYLSVSINPLCTCLLTSVVKYLSVLFSHPCPISNVLSIDLCVGVQSKHIGAD